MSSDQLISRLEALRRTEKEQALAYRSLAARAEDANDADLAQRFHDLHADEQHHLSRLTARILELGGRPAELTTIGAVELPLEAWRPVVRAREEAQIRRFRDFLQSELDDGTRALIENIVEVEARHVLELGGKWTVA